MNSYEIKMEEKRERYAERSERARGESSALYQRSKTMFDAIPFGQPILVGHHSERGDRAYRNRAGSLMNRSIEADKKASYYEEKAENFGTHGISSDDPDAVEKLKVKLAKLETLQAMMREDNASARKQGLDRVFAPYQLSNNNANIRNVKERIERLEKESVRKPIETIIGNGWTMREDPEENRIMFLFPGKPDEATRSILKRRGFKWSPSRDAWVRMLNANGRLATKWIIEELKNL
jgi:hypothetical protein